MLPTTAAESKKNGPKRQTVFFGTKKKEMKFNTNININFNININSIFNITFA